jgi:hypothetical protein
VLSQTGALLAVGDTLVAGLSGRLVGLNPINGAVRWETAVATSRGTNEVERLVDIVGPVSRIGNSVCARAYSAAVGCVDASRGTTVWTRAAQGVTGVHGDDRLVFGSETDGRFQAWQRSSGEPAWNIDRLKYRGLSAPTGPGPRGGGGRQHRPGAPDLARRRQRNDAPHHRRLGHPRRPRAGRRRAGGANAQRRRLRLAPPVMPTPATNTVFVMA